MIQKKRNRTFIIYLASLAAFAPFSTDIYLASMPTIQHLFKTSVENVQLTLSLFFVAFAIGLLFWGPLSDRIGRKPVIFLGVTIFLLGSLLSAWSDNILLLISARIIQALGACSGIVMAIAIVKDSFPDEKEMSKVLSGMMSVSFIAPMVAPIIGSYLLVHLNWQANFYLLSIFGAIILLSTFFIEESYPKSSRKALPINQLLNAYFKQASLIPFLLATLALSTNFSVMFAFIASSSFIYIKIYHLPAHLFGYFFAFNAAALILGTLSLGRLKNKFGEIKLIFMAISLSIIGAIIMTIAILLHPNSLWSVVLPSFVVTLGVGILYPELMAQILKNVVDYTGMASSLAGTFRFILAAIIGFLMGVMITHSALPLGIAMLTLNLLTALFMLFYFNNLRQKKQSVALLSVQ